MSLQRSQPVALPQIRDDDGVTGAPPPANGSGTGGGSDRPLVRLNLLRALQLHRRLALGFALAGLLLALAYAIKTWPVYTAQSQIYIQPTQSKVMGQGNDQSEPINSAAYDSFVQQQVQSASNPVVLVSALHKLGPGNWQKQGEPEQVAADRLGHAVEVARVGTSYEVAISSKASNPNLAAQIANAVANSIVENAAGEGNAGDAERITVLREERDRIQNELNADYAEQNDLNQQLGMAAVGTSAPDLIDDEIGKTREELIKAQTDHDEAEARYSAMNAGQGDASTALNAEADDLVAADAGLTSMKTSLNQRRAVLISQMANLTPTNPEYKQDAAELAKINGSLDSMMKDLRTSAARRIQEKLRTDLERTSKVEGQLNGQLRQLAQTAAGATPKLQRVNDLATDIVRLRARFSTVDEQVHNLMLQDSVPGAVHLSVAAVPPLHPTLSGILKKALPLALGGLLFGLLAASIANHLDPRVYIAADIEQTLGFAPMAVLPDFDEVPDEVASEQLLRLSATIEHARKQGSLKSCIFTGTSSGTGVTTVARRVREILEAMGRPTVLLDASGTPPPAPRASASPNSFNPMLDDPAAQRGSRSTALLQQAAEEARTQHEGLVLTDTAPLAISAETEYLARFVDCVIVVIESGVTTRAQLVAAVNSLQRLEVATVGFVLNRVGLAKADPAFRDSVRETEKHLRAQSQSVSRRTVRSAEVVEPSQSAPEHFLPEHFSDEAAVRARLAAAIAEPAQEAPIHLPSSAAAEWPKTERARPSAEPAPQNAMQPTAPVLQERPEVEPVRQQVPEPVAEAPVQDSFSDSHPSSSPVGVAEPVPVALPEAVSEAPVQPPSPAVPEWAVAEPLRAPLPLPQPVAEVAAPRPSPEVSERDEPGPILSSLNHPLQASGADVPWWLAEVQSQRPAESRQPIEPRKPMAPYKASEPDAGRSGSDTSGSNTSGSNTSWLTAPRHRIGSWEDVPAEHGEFLLHPAPQAVPEAAQTEVRRNEPEIALDPLPPGKPPEKPEQNPDLTPYPIGSRLSSLRGLLFSLGLKDLGKARGSDPEDEQSLQTIETDTDRTSLFRTFTPFAEPAPTPIPALPAVSPAVPVPVPVPGPVLIEDPKTVSEPAMRVTAQPEFLPPREFIPMKDREPIPETPSSTRGDRREEFDDLQILPSRRGQYKKRS